MKSINTSIEFNIYIIDNFSFVLNFFNSENKSIAIILNDIILFRFTLLRAYSNIVSSYHFHRIRLCPWEIIRSEKAYCKKWNLAWRLIWWGAKSRLKYCHDFMASKIPKSATSMDSCKISEIYPTYQRQQHQPHCTQRMETKIRKIWRHDLVELWRV